MDPTLRILIADDEPIARKRLALLCEKLPDVVVVGEATDGSDTLNKIEERSPDLVLLDISMPERDGVAVAALLSGAPHSPAIVFCTASPNHAVQAFDVAAIDYLLKPVTLDRLARAVSRLRDRRVASHLPDKAAVQDHFWVPHRGTMRRVEIGEIRRIDAEGDFVRITTGTAHYLIHETLTRLEDRLDPTIFVRLRRSTVMRQSEIRGIRHLGFGAWETLLADGSSVRIGPTYWKAIKARMSASSSWSDGVSGR